MNIQEYMESGMLEAYVLGLASDTETCELLLLKAQYPQVRKALDELELDMERIAKRMAVIPSPGTWVKIEQEINTVTGRPVCH